MKGEKRVERTRWLWHHADGFSKRILGKYQDIEAKKMPSPFPKKFSKQLRPHFNKGDSDE
jgi:hypothetical protein